jgi:hypothetical protein
VVRETKSEWVKLRDPRHARTWAAGSVRRRVRGRPVSRECSSGDWVVVRIGVAPTKMTGTATKPPPVAPHGDPHSAIERAAWFAGGGR